MKHLVLLFFVIINTHLYGQTKDSLSLELQQFINNEIQLEGLSVTSAKLKKMQRYKTNKVVILDARDIVEFRSKRIKGAKRVGYNDSNFTVKNIWFLKKTKKIVVYSNKGINSKVAAKRLRELGFSNTYNLIGGLEDWTRKLLPVVGKKTKK